MTARVATVAFQGVDVASVEVQVQIAAGLPSFQIVGLPDKAVTESRERVRAALSAIGLALPAKRVIVNLAPADLIKEGGHFDLPVALGLLAAMDALPSDALDRHAAMGELALDGRLASTAGALPAAIAARRDGRGLICPAACGGEAALAGDASDIVAAPDLLSLIAHLRGEAILTPPAPADVTDGDDPTLDLADVRGQETAKRALEIAAAGGHNLLMVGPPGAGKSMLAARLPTLMPDLPTPQALELAMIRSVAGAFAKDGLSRRPPFRDPHHSASQVALVGGGRRARPGEISLAHGGVLFLDELPEFQRAALESLRQPMETGAVAIARAESHVRYPARFQLVAAMNPCRCGHLDDPALACRKAPRCAEAYQARLSGPLLDRIDLHVDVPALDAADLHTAPAGAPSADIAARVAAARARQTARYGEEGPRCNAEVDGALLDAAAALDGDAETLLQHAAHSFHLSARAYRRVLRTARTIADLAGAAALNRAHLAEALSFRRRPPAR